MWHAPSEMERGCPKIKVAQNVLEHILVLEILKFDYIFENGNRFALETARPKTAKRHTLGRSPGLCVYLQTLFLGTLTIKVQHFLFFEFANTVLTGGLKAFQTIDEKVLQHEKEVQLYSCQVFKMLQCSKFILFRL